jgi:hypothetical protein
MIIIKEIFIIHGGKKCVIKSVNSVQNYKIPSSLYYEVRQETAL